MKSPGQAHHNHSPLHPASAGGVSRRFARSAALSTAFFTGALLVAAAPADAAKARASASSVCAPLQGDQQRWRANADRRRAAVIAVDSDDGQVEIVYSDPTLRAPMVTGIDGLDVARVQKGPRGELSASLAVDGALAKACAADDLVLRRDESLGRGYQVVDIIDSGVLLLGDDGFAFVPREGTSAPDFRMVWQAPFALQFEQPQAKAATSRSRANRTKIPKHIPRRKSR